MSPRRTKSPARCRFRAIDAKIAITRGDVLTPLKRRRFSPSTPAPRPPSIAVDDDAPLRRDVDSVDMRRVHPDLPVDATPDDRNAHQRACDARAYERIRARFPAFRPPGGAL